MGRFSAKKEEEKVPNNEINSDDNSERQKILTFGKVGDPMSIQENFL